MPNIPYNVRVDSSSIEHATVRILCGQYGAEISFLGIVRGMEDGGLIKGIVYQCYEEMAGKVLASIAAEAQQKFGSHRSDLHHRIGFVAVGEPSLRISVATPHSAPAFEICQYLLARIKEEAPVWKHPVFESEP